MSALDEAVDIIRGLWDVDDPGPLRVLGDHYRIDGAQRGPRLSHPVPIWIGAYKPRMLRLAGRKGDGWVAGLPSLGKGELTEDNRIIDEAAVTAGRDPEEIVRMLTLVPAALADRALVPRDRGYERYTAGYFRGARPGLVLRPQKPAEVQDAVRYADRHRDVPLGILSGGGAT